MNSQLSLPSYWQVSDLSDCLVLNDSGTWGTVGSEGKGFPILRSTNIQNGKLTLDNVAWCDVSPELAPKYELQNGDIIITKSSGSPQLIGKNALFVHPNDGNRYLFSNFTQRLRVDTSIIIPEYLFYYLNSSYALAFLEQIQNTTSGLRNLSIKLYVTQKIPLPTLTEQRRIVDILRQADTLHQWRHNANDKYEELVKALFIQMFGDPYTNPKRWEIVSVESLKHPNKPVIRTGPFGSSLKKHEYTQQGIPVWGIDNVKPNEFVEQNSLFVSATKFQQLRNYEVNDGDVLISRAGTTGRMCVAHPKQSPSIIGTNLIRLSLDQERIFPEFFTTMFTFLGDRVARTLRASGESDAYSFINPKDLKSLTIPLPNIELQREFFFRLNTIKAINVDQKISEEKLEALMQSLLVRAFTGELTISWREKHKDELQRSAAERDKALGLRGEKPRLIDFEEGRVTPEELEVIRNALGNFAANLASYHIDVDGLARSLEEITKPLTQSLVSMRQNLITPFLESFRQSLQNIQLALPVPPDEDEINRQIDLLPLPQEKRAIHDVLDATSLRVLRLAHASSAYFTPENLTFGGITSTHTSASLRVLDSLGFVRLVEIDGVLRYHVIDANTDTALKPDQLQQ